MLVPLRLKTSDILSYKIDQSTLHNFTEEGETITALSSLVNQDHSESVFYSRIDKQSCFTLHDVLST
jgi:hypothetical protein